jgi:hypothetical protein
MTSQSVDAPFRVRRTSQSVDTLFLVRRTSQSVDTPFLVRRTFLSVETLTPDELGVSFCRVLSPILSFETAGVCDLRRGIASRIGDAGVGEATATQQT